MDDKIEDDLQTLDKLIAANSPDTCSAEGDLSQLLADTYAQYAVDCPTLVHIIFCALLSKRLSKFVLTDQKNKPAIQNNLGGSMANTKDLVCNTSSSKISEETSEYKEEKAGELRQWPI